MPAKNTKITKPSASKPKKATPVSKTVKRAVAKKPASKAVKTPVKKAASGKTEANVPWETRPKDNTKFTIPPKILLEQKAEEKKGERIEDLVIERKIELKSVDEYMGLQQKQDYRNKPIIEGMFDLLIPPGTPRKLIIKLAKEYPIQLVRRDDIYIPIGVGDVERDLLAIRGDEKTIQKMAKILLDEIDDYIEGHDARLHNYSKPIKLEGVSPTGNPKVKAKPKLKAKAKK